MESVTGKGKEADLPPSGKILDDSKHSLKAGGARRLGPARQDTTFLILDVTEASQDYACAERLLAGQQGERASPRSRSGRFPLASVAESSSAGDAGARPRGR